MAAAEYLFAADARVALAQRHTAARGVVDADALTAASMVDLAMAFTADVTTGLRWLIEHFPHEPVPTDPAVCATTMRLTNPNAQTDLDAALAEGVGPAWRRRRNALNAYRQAPHRPA